LRKWAGKGLLWSLSLILSGCIPWQDSFLKKGTGSLTQSDVRERLGKPHIVKAPLLSDETTWTYRYALSESELDPWGIKTFGKQAGSVFGGQKGGPREKVYCYSYVLTFDKAGVLRHWDRETCQLPAPPDPFTQGLS
jgi:hypothetical protein